MNYEHVDLFSGIGGFALAARWAGIKTVQFVEIDKFCQKVLQKNFPGVPIHDDIKTFTYAETRREPQFAASNNRQEGHGNTQKQFGIGTGDRDGTRSFTDGIGIVGRSPTEISTSAERPFLLTGGFPCQPFSCAGKRRGKEDDRYLWPEMLRVILEAKPRWVIGENVAGFINMGLDDCISDLERESYEVQAFVIPACAVNAPHRRDRAWIVGNLHGAERDERAVKKIQGNKQSSDTSRGNCSDSDPSERGCGMLRRTSGEDGFSIFNDKNAPIAKSRKRLSRYKNESIISGGEARQKRSGCIVNVSNSESERLEGCIKTDREKGQKPHDELLHGCRGEWDEPWLEVATRLCRVDDGLPRRVDRVNRLKALGNAIVPQVAYQIMKAIIEVEKKKRVDLIETGNTMKTSEVRHLPWTGEEFRKKHNKDLTDKQAKKAAQIANSILADSGDEALAIKTANARAKLIKE